MSGWLIYHPKREVSKFGRLIVYHDRIGGNQDPYVWNEQFLHSFCHMTEMSPQEGDICFWVSGDQFPNFTKLWCDLVFVVKDKFFWKSVNEIDQNDPLVDSHEAFKDHYYPGSLEHRFGRRKTRFTLKADPDKSFQPQARTMQLIDVLPVLESLGISNEFLRVGLRSPKGFGSKPLPLDTGFAKGLYLRLHRLAEVKIRGRELQRLRNMGSELRVANLGTRHGRMVKISKRC